MEMRTLRYLWDQRHIQRQVQAEIFRQSDRPVPQGRERALQRRRPPSLRNPVRPVGPPRCLPAPRRPRASNVSAPETGFERVSTSFARFNETYLGPRYSRMRDDARRPSVLRRDFLGRAGGRSSGERI